MPIIPPNPFRPGVDVESVGFRNALEQMWDWSRRIGNLRVEGLPFENTPGGITIGEAPEQPARADFHRMYAEITGHDASSPWKHSAKEVRATDGVGFLLWEDMPNGIVWDTVNLPLESIRFWVEALAVGSIVEVYTLPLTNGPSASLIWFFDDRMEHLTEFQAEITGNSGSDYSWKEKDFDASGVQRDRPDGRTGLFSNSLTKAVEVNGLTEVSTGTVVNMQGTLLSNQNTRFWFLSPGCSGDNASPDTVGTTAETESAQTDTWDRENQGAKDGLDFVMLTRMAYDHTGDEKLYGYYRTLEFDSCGKLKEVSAETRITIDTPEDGCS